RAAKRNVDHRALPGHPARQSAYFVESYIGRVADAAFSRPTGNRMLYAKAGKDFKPSIVHGNGDVHDDLTAGILQNFPKTRVKIEFLGGKIESSLLSFPGIQLLLKRYGFHCFSKAAKRKRKV